MQQLCVCSVELVLVAQSLLVLRRGVLAGGVAQEFISLVVQVGDLAVLLVELRHQLFDALRVLIAFRLTDLAFGFVRRALDPRVPFLVGLFQLVSQEAVLSVANVNRGLELFEPFFELMPVDLVLFRGQVLDFVLALRGEDVQLLDVVLSLGQLLFEARDFGFAALSLVFKVLDRPLVLAARVVHFVLQLRNERVESVDLLFAVGDALAQA